MEPANPGVSGWGSNQLNYPARVSILFYLSLTTLIRKLGLKKLSITYKVTQCWRQSYSQCLRNRTKSQNKKMPVLQFLTATLVVCSRLTLYYKDTVFIQIHNTFSSAPTFIKRVSQLCSRQTKVFFSISRKLGVISFGSLILFLQMFQIFMERHLFSHLRPFTYT